MRFPAAASSALAMATSLTAASLLHQPTKAQQMMVFNTVGVTSFGDPTCPTDTKGEALTVAANAEADAMPACDGCRNFEAEPAGPGCPGGNDDGGFDLTFNMGDGRGSISVRSCPDADLLTFVSAGGDTSAFTPNEVAFFNKLADNIEANPVDDINTPGSLEMLAIRTARALAAWPSEFMPVSGTYTSDTIASWFSPADLLVGPECAIDENFVPAPSAAAPTEAAPTGPAPTIASKNTVTAPVEAPVPKPTFPLKTNAVPPVNPPTPAPCTDICKVTSDGTQLLLEMACVEDAKLMDHYNDHPCDFAVRSGCECDRDWTMPVFNSCAPPTCPDDNVIQRLNPDGSISPLPPTVAPTFCIDICKVYKNPATGGLSVEQDCLGPNTFDGWLEDHVCDWVPTPGCECTSIGSIGDIRGCAGEDRCPSNPSQHLNEEGLISGTVGDPNPNSVQVCHLRKDITKDPPQLIALTKSIDPSERKPCDYDIRDGCPCPPPSFQDILKCVSPVDCPDDFFGRLQDDGDLEPPMPPQGGCNAANDVLLCHIEYESNPDTGGYIFRWNQDCLKDNEWTAHQEAFPCDWEVTDGCDCSVNFHPDMVEACSTCEYLTNPPPQLVTQPSRTICHLEVVGNQLNIDERPYPLDEAQAMLDNNDCDFEVSDPDCQCLVNGQFDQGQINVCSPDKCPYKQRRMMRKLRKMKINVIGSGDDDK